MRPPIVLAILAVQVAACSAPTTPSLAPEARTGPRALACDPCELAVEVSEQARAFEPAAAVNPADAAHWLIASKQWHPSGSAPAIMRHHVSFDRGAHWETRRFPGDIPLDHPLSLYAAFLDPNVMLFEDGSALLSAMAARGLIGPGGSPVEDVNGFPVIDGFDLIVARSEDGGLSWPDARVVSLGSAHPAAPVTVYNDQPFLARGPQGEVLLVWSYRLLQGANEPTRVAQIRGSMSRDGGLNWSEPVTISDGLGEFHRPRATIADDGEMLVSYQDLASRETNLPVFVARSRDGSQWTQTATSIQSRRGAWIGAHGDDIYLASSQSRAGVPVVAVHRLSDSAPATVTHPADRPGDVTPTLVLTPAGTIVVASQIPNARGNQYWVWTRDAAGRESRLRLDRSPLGANDPEGLLGWPIFGDYQGLAVGPGGVLVAWISGDAQDTDLRAAWLPLR